MTIPELAQSVIGSGCGSPCRQGVSCADADTQVAGMVPIPNQMTSTGARARTGVAWAATMSAVRAASSSRPFGDLRCVERC